MTVSPDRTRPERNGSAGSDAPPAFGSVRPRPDGSPTGRPPASDESPSPARPLAPTSHRPPPCPQRVADRPPVPCLMLLPLGDSFPLPIASWTKTASIQ
ncbi:hypothetical protein C1862_08655 [Eggerthella lenta]|nr:hypothetical protein C1870_10195 [Eggerthella lenta]RDB87999.1 hypothetical protein C1869_09740 [Eggerthella lenta]RDC09656.1 hypothetical protein C1862_08655 [Eggerthella lenta]